jgi:hypothetical protein
MTLSVVLIDLAAKLAAKTVDIAVGYAGEKGIDKVIGVIGEGQNIVDKTL